jgi:urease accessory protein
VDLDIESAAPECGNTPFVSAPGWRASLQLRCERAAEKSVLTRRAHCGPLRLLKPLYPEGDGVCHAVIVHPPGGIVSGDELDIDITVADRGHLLVTTPGAQKWYRSSGQSAFANTVARVGTGSALEWLPQESMLFDGANVSQRLSVQVHENARFFGWEILCLGRATRDERFTQGLFRQHLKISRVDTLIWSEHTLLRGNDPLLNSPLGFAGNTVMATAWLVCSAAESTADVEQLAIVRAALADHTMGAASNPASGLIVIKVLSDSAEEVRHLLTRVWSRIRPKTFATAPHIPRIWST